MDRPKIILFTLFFIGGVLISTLSSCNNNSGTMGVQDPKQNASVSMLASNSGSGSGNGTLVITGAKFLIEWIKIETSPGRDDGDIKEGPFEVFINLDGTVSLIAINNIPSGTFHEVHLKIHKFTPGERVIDPDFEGLNGGPGFSGIITGTYNGVPFTFKTAITSVEEVEISPPVVVTAAASTTTNVTLTINPKLWFIDQGQVLNPLDPNNQHEIDESIRTSFIKAFEDDDHDGLPDEHEGHHGGH
jgi:hypothetical protein